MVGETVLIEQVVYPRGIFALRQSGRDSHFDRRSGEVSKDIDAKP